MEFLRKFIFGHSNSDLTYIPMQVINWLMSDFLLFGLRIQIWMPAFISVFIVVLFFSWLDQRRLTKRNGRSF